MEDPLFYPRQWSDKRKRISDVQDVARVYVSHFMRTVYVTDLDYAPTADAECVFSGPSWECCAMSRRIHTESGYGERDVLWHENTNDPDQFLPFSDESEITS